MPKTTTKFNLMEVYIQKVCWCDIHNQHGTNNIWINLVDVFCYLCYLAITISTLWIEGIATLPFFATLILIIRSFLKHLKSTYNTQKNGDRIIPTHQNRVLIYGFLIVFIAIMYCTVSTAYIREILLTICYGIFALYELTDILLDCYDATPRVLKV